MSANILDPRMIDPSRPLSSFEIKTSFLTVDNSLIAENLDIVSLETDSLSTQEVFTSYLTTEVAEISSATIEEAFINNSVFTGTVVSDITAQTVAVSSYLITSNDNSKILHFDTTSEPSISAVFDDGLLQNGFNVGIINIGTGIIYIDSDFSPPINASGTFNSVQHSGMFIYKINDQLFGIGVFE